MGGDADSVLYRFGERFGEVGAPKNFAVGERLAEVGERFGLRGGEIIVASEGEIHHE